VSGGAGGDRLSIVPPDHPLLRPETSVSQSSVVVSASLLLTALLGAGQALLIVLIVGEGDRTDAFLAAYSLYVVFAILGASTRVSAVPLLGGTSSESQFRDRTQDLLSRIIVLGLLAMAVLAVVAVPAGHLLALGLPADARWVAVLALLVLAPATFLQIYAAIQSAVLIGARRFSASAALYVISGAVALGGSAALLDLFGVLGAAFGLLAGAFVLAAGHAAYMRRFGVRPRPHAYMLTDRRQREVAVVLLAAASISVALQLNLAIALAAISHEPGAITAYSYGFFIVSLALAISSFPLGMVTISDLVDDYARRGLVAAREYFARVPPYAFAVLAPALAAFAADGKPLLEGIFADSLSPSTIQLVYEIGLVLSLMALPTALLFLAGSVTLALGQARRFLPLSVVTVALQAALALPASSISPQAVASAHAATLLIATALLLRLTFGPGWAGVTAVALRRSLPAFALASVFGLVRLPFGSDPGVVAALAAAIIGLIAYVALALLVWRSVSRAFVDLVRRQAR
jgi:putative peptidoglycan lipid II flippase